MKLVIDISEEYYKTIKETKKEVVPIGWVSIQDGIKYEERPHGEWIPCAERLPEHGGFFLITNIDELVRVDFFRKSTNDFDNYSAIAWMPLPEPYKEEGDAE